jgi:paraquat-inducible protein B
VVRPNRFRLSLVWLVPLLALVIGASLAVRSILATGPRIEIDFNTAEGLEPGKTEVRYKEVVIGRVEAVSLRDDRQRVVVTVQLDRSAAGVARQDTQFWVVRPRIGTGGVSGLGTLLSGAYIGVDAGTSDIERERFVGLEAPPFMLRGEPGGSFVLVADDLGSLDVGSPIYYRRARVGRVVGYQLDPKRDELTVKIFVEAPYQSLITPQTRFWNASGLDLSLNANGLTLDTQTLSSVLAGGVSFERLPNSGPPTPAADGSRFVLYNDRKTAMAPPYGEPVPVRMVFDQSVRGLTVGAPVDFLGVDIGTVREITLRRDLRRKRFPVEVTADLYPLRLGSLRTALMQPAAAASAPSPGTAASAPDARPADSDAAVIRRLAAQGLKAQMRTGNLLTGQLYVALDFFREGEEPVASDAKPRKPAPPGSRRALREERRARLEARAAAAAEAEGVLTLPTVAGTLSEIQPQVAQIVNKLSRIPFDQIGQDLKSTLSQANNTLAQLTPDARKALADVSATLNRAQASLDALDRNLLQENAPVQQRAEQTLAEVQRAAQSLRVLADYLQAHPESLLRGKPPDAPLQNTSRRGSRPLPADSPAPATRPSPNPAALPRTPP